MLRKFESGSAVSRWLYPTQSNSFQVIYIEYGYILNIISTVLHLPRSLGDKCMMMQDLISEF